MCTAGVDHYWPDGRTDRRTLPTGNCFTFPANADGNIIANRCVNGSVQLAARRRVKTVKGFCNDKRTHCVYRFDTEAGRRRPRMLATRKGVG